jgi:hypothetical protein
LLMVHQQCCSARTESMIPDDSMNQSWMNTVNRWHYY